MRLLILFISLVYVIVPSLPALAVTAQQEEKNLYTSNEKRGIWWGKYDSKDPEESPQDKDQKKQGTEDSSIPPPLSDYKMEDIWNMYPDQFDALTKNYRKKAVQTLTEEDVKDYLTLQDIARRKSGAFMNVWRLVLQKHPELSVSKDYSPSRVGTAARVRMENQDIDSKLRSGSEDFALLYFYSPGCEYCKVQDGINWKFSADYGWTIKKIDINEYPDLAARFSITTVPTLLLIHRDKPEPLPVAVGVITADLLPQRVYAGMRLLLGETDPEQFGIYEHEDGGSFDPKANRSK